MENFRRKIETLYSTVEVTEKSVLNGAGNVKLVRLKRYDTDKDFVKGDFYSSSGYALKWFYNKNEGTCRINVSIPKYLYGQNVIMWIPHERIYNWEDIDLTILKNEFFKIVESIVLCFSNSNRLYSEEAINIKISRIDYCFNYVFRTSYLRDACYDSILNKRKKYARIGDNTYSYKNQTIMHKTKKYSVKYYKKDHEFRKFGLKQYEQDYGLKNAAYYLDIAKRTLRFEVSMRNLKMSWAFRNYIARNHFKILPEETDFTTCNFRLYAPKVNINSIDQFYMQKDFNIDEKFFQSTLNDFIDMLEEWRVETFISEEKFLQAVERGKKQYPKMRWNRFYQYWEHLKTKSIDQLAKENIIHRNSVPNIIKAFNLIGLDIKKAGTQDFEYLPDFYDYIRAVNT